MKKVIAIVFLFLLFSPFISINISHSQTEYVPIYFILNDSKDIHITLTNGGSVEDWTTINETVIAYIFYGAIAILTSKYPFTINGKPAIYANTTDPVYFYEFRVLQPQTLEIDFLPKPLPNTPIGYITLDGQPFIVNKTITYSVSPIIVTSTTITTTTKQSIVNILEQNIVFVLFLSIITLGLIGALIERKKRR